ncbi:helix-turn-helix domain-containing protein [Pseudogemmobacter sonorensis]|uniref:helix-turn-helix domain-containing protein n=1 Tax=Pseudogemmobacter sonorensis TaxID=2989681 RepID=UPI003673BF19
MEPLIWLRHHGIDLAPPQDSQPVSRLRRLLEADLSHPWRISEVAQHFVMSKATLRRCLAGSGQGFAKILHNARLERGLGLLQTSDPPISRIALDCGFGTPSHFSDSLENASEYRRNRSDRPVNERFSTVFDRSPKACPAGRVYSRDFPEEGKDRDKHFITALVCAGAALPAIPASAQDFALTSTSIAEGVQLSGNQLSAGFGCEGGNTSPLAWSGAPEGTKSFAVTA